MGKTRLALELAARVIPSATDGVRLVELASLTEAGLVPERVAATLGIRALAEGSLLATLTKIVGHRRLLLILDNCEHVVEACANLTEALLKTCPHVRVLATSREPLGIRGEQVWPVSPLSLADDASESTSESVRLFVARAAAAVPKFSLTDENRHAVGEICAHLDGIPLAIELAAARLRALTPEQVVARLDDCLRLLVGGSRTALPRQRTLAATLDWSFYLLTAAERVLLARLSVFAGGWTLQAAEVVGSGAAVATDDVLGLLIGLIDKSLVLPELQHDEARYRQLEPIRQYGAERLGESGELEQVRGIPGVKDRVVQQATKLVLEHPSWWTFLLSRAETRENVHDDDASETLPFFGCLLAMTWSRR